MKEFIVHRADYQEIQVVDAKDSILSIGRYGGCRFMDRRL
jgi:hypothetical protein